LKYEEIILKLKSFSDIERTEGMASFGINTAMSLGISISKLRSLAKKIGKDHKTAQKLWSSGFHEARILASMIDESELVSEEQMDSWVRDFNSWDLCDQVCNNLFRKTEYSYQKAAEWSKSREEFVKRAAFVLMAVSAVHDKNADDEIFIGFLELIKKTDQDKRKYVKKAVSWALRQIGKRNLYLNKAAVRTSEKILDSVESSHKWAAADALKELKSEKVKQRLEA